MKLNFIASLFGAVSVALGALRTHYLKDKLSEDQLHSLTTAVYFALFHIPLFLFLNTSIELSHNPIISKASKVLFAGILCFSGSIYILVFLKPYVPKFFGFVTPIGGVLLIVSWVLLAIYFLRGSSFS